MISKAVRILVVFALLAAALLAALPLLAAGAALDPPSEVWVDDDYNPSTPGWGVTHFANIQDGVNAVASGGTVHVAAGTYAGNIVIRKSVTLLGDPGDASPGPGTNAPVIDGGSTPGSAFFIENGVSDVTIQGFEMCNFTSNDNGIGNGVSAWEASTSDITIQDNYFHHLGWNGVLVGNDGAIGDHSNWSIKGNVAADVDYIAFELTNTSDSSIEGNVIHLNSPDIGAVFSSARRSEKNLTIKDNVIDGTPSALFPVIYIYAYDLEVANPKLDGVLIEGNTISTSGTPYQVYIRNIGTGTVTNVEVHGNTLSTLKNLTSALVDAENNYWGTVVFSEIRPKISGWVDWSPWCNADFSYCSYTWPVHNVTQGIDYQTIQEAVSAANPGDVIQADAGVYNESVLLTRSVTLVGAGAASTFIDGTGLAGGSLPVFAGSLRALVAVNPPSAAGSPYLVRIEGFTIRNSQAYGLGANGNGKGIVRLQVVGSAFAGNSLDNLFMNDVDATSGAPSLLQGNTFNGPAGSYLDGSDYIQVLGNSFIDAGSGSDQGLGMQQGTNVWIEGNLFDGWDDEGLVLNATTSQPLNNNTIRNNTFRNAGGGAGCGIWLTQIANGAGFGTLDIRGNVFSNNAGSGVALTPGSYTAGSISGVTIYGNSFDGTGMGVSNAYAATVNASGNWWGSSAPAAVAGEVSGSVDYTPWLASGTDTSADPGFQGDFSTLWVDDDSPQTGTKGRIQEGIDLVSGSTVNVAAGTYSDCLNIVGRSNLTIQGADKTTTVIKPNCTYNWDVGGYGGARKAAVRVVDSDVVSFFDISLDFDLVKGNNVAGLFYWNSTGRVEDCVLKNMSLPDASGYYYEITSYVRAPTGSDASRKDITFYRNTFINTGRLGIVTHEWVAAEIRENTFYKTVDDFGYAMEIGSASEAQVIGNVIYGYDTPAASDGSESAGIYVENAFTGGWPHVDKNVLLQGNEIYDCQWGVYVGNEWSGYAGDVDILLSGTGNNLHDNVVGAILLTDHGKSAGSSVTATFSGNTLTDNGDYGYYLYTQGDGNLTVTVNGDTITGHDTGVYLEDTAGGGSSSSYSIAFHNSFVVGNTSYGMRNTYAGTMIDAINNYWGDPSGPYDPTGTTEVPPCTADPASEKNADGTGDAVSDNVDYCPWSQYVPPEADLQAVLDASCGGTVYLGPYTYKGGLTIGCGLTIQGVAGAKIIPGSHGMTVAGDDVTIDGITFDGSGGAPGDCGIWVNDGVERLWVRNCEIKNWPDDGLHFAGAITDLKLVDNYVHDNAGDGVDFAATPGGAVDIYGNAFRANTGYGMSNAGGTDVDAEYNEWGDIAGPTGPDGDGVVGSVDYDPWVFAKLWVDAPAKVRELESVTVYVRMDVNHLYGSHFGLTFPTDKLVLTAEPVIGSFKTSTTGAYFGTNSMGQANATGVITFTGYRADPDAEYDATNDILLTLTFQAKEITGVEQEATIAFAGDTADAGAKGGVRIFLDSATWDTIKILGTTTVSGLVDLQGRDNDSGASVEAGPGVTHGQSYGPVVTNSWGRYSISNMTDDTYEFRIEMARYLDAKATVVVSGDTKTLNKVILLGGDANDDDVVDISDAGIIGGEFGKSPPGDVRADINNDGTVDILDLVLMGGNFHRSSPVPWTP